MSENILFTVHDLLNVKCSLGYLAILQRMCVKDPVLRGCKNSHLLLFWCGKIEFWLGKIF